MKFLFSKSLNILNVAKHNQSLHLSKYFSTTIDTTSKDGIIGFIGLGSMGSKMIENLHRDGKEVMIYDKSKKAVKNILNTYKTGVSEVIYYL
jgi:lactate dehydrogenase-like 2-hydroxyacid dehydrogenase